MVFTEKEILIVILDSLVNKNLRQKKREINM